MEALETFEVVLGGRALGALGGELFVVVDPHTVCTQGSMGVGAKVTVFSLGDLVLGRVSVGVRSDWACSSGGRNCPKVAREAVALPATETFPS